ncbi:hypothetical protein Tco_0266030 [Tanacetum coccineum]
MPLLLPPGMFKLDIEPISHILKNIRDAHEVYLNKTIENIDTLRGLVECVRKQNPSGPLLESACMFTKHVQELLVYVSKTCHGSIKPSEKLVAATPMKKDKKVRLCFDANHDMYVNDYVNVRSKSKRNKKRKVWKPTGKVFTEIGYSWKPTRRNFTIVGNRCPLTRITSTKVVPTKETTNKSVLTPTQGIIDNNRRSKAPKLVGPSSKYKITESRISNSSVHIQSGGSTVSNAPSSSLIDCRCGSTSMASMTKVLGYGIEVVSFKL